MVKRTGLGKGLEALLPSGGGADGDNSYFSCPIGAIVPNPSQPRKSMDDGALRELAASVKEKGVLLPLVVRETSAGMFEIIAGERRWRAAMLAGLTELPVLVKDVSPQDRLELALIENIQRQDLNALEEAEAYHRLVTEFALTQEEVAKRVGKERSTVANTLRIINLPDFAKEDLAGGMLTMGHARVLLSLGSPEAMREVRDEILSHGLNVRQAEALVKKKKELGKPARNSSPAKRLLKKGQLPESYCLALTNDLGEYLGTRVRITQSASRGKVEIEYYSADDLDRVMALIIK
jgi:ParB family chromosome partitioning protein